MTNFLQVLLTGLGLGSAYALFAQGVVLIYRGSGIVNFAQGALGMLASYVTFYELRTTNSWPIGLAIVGGIAAAVLVALLFQAVVLRLLTNAAPIVRLISTLGLLIVVQAAVELRYGASNIPVQPYLPHDVFRWGDVVVQEQVLYIIGITCVITAALWALARYTRVGLAISAAAQNERAVQTMGWSPTKLSALTWGVGAGLAGIAGVLIAPLTGLSTITFTLIVTVTAMAAALLGGFRSFPLTLLGGFIIGFGEAWVVRHRLDVQNFFGVGDLPGIERAIPFLLILLVLVVRGRGLPAAQPRDRPPAPSRHRARERPGTAHRLRRSAARAVHGDGRVVGGGDEHLDHLGDHRAVDRRADRLRGPAVPRPVGARGVWCADRGFLGAAPRHADGARHPSRRAAHDSRGAVVRAPCTPDPGRQPRHRDARPGFHDPGRRVRQVRLDRRGARRRHAHRLGRVSSGSTSTTRTILTVGQWCASSDSSLQAWSSPISVGREPADV